MTGVRHIPEADRVLATVLFTDIVGATEQAATLKLTPAKAHAWARTARRERRTASTRSESRGR